MFECGMIVVDVCVWPCVSCLLADTHEMMVWDTSISVRSMQPCSSRQLHGAAQHAQHSMHSTIHATHRSTPAAGAARSSARGGRWAPLRLPRHAAAPPAGVSRPARSRAHASHPRPAARACPGPRPGCAAPRAPGQHRVRPTRGCLGSASRGPAARRSTLSRIPHPAP